MITCDQALELLSAQLDGAITIEEQTALQEHLAACPECRRIQSELRMADEALPGLQQEPPQLLHDAVRMAEQDLAISCEDDVSTASGKERHTKLCLKDLDGMGQGRLGNVKGFCCARQVLQLGCLLEIAQGEQCQFHGDPPND